MLLPNRELSYCVRQLSFCGLLDLVTSGCLMRRHDFLARFILVATLAAAVMMPRASAWAVSETRVALVIGNSVYQNTDALRNPENDAKELAKVLERLGFKVILGLNLGTREMDLMRATFEKTAAEAGDGPDRRADVALFFYAGHGLQFGGANYLMPVDAKIGDQRSAARELIALEDILREMRNVAKTSLVFLDACRNNPLAGNLSDSLSRGPASSRGLAPVTSSDDTLLVFATAPGKTADDGLDGQHSPFTKALLSHIEVPGVDIEVMLKRVQRDVQAATKGDQRPERLSKLETEFQFVPGATDPSPVIVRPATPAKADVAEWNKIKDSDDPAVFAAYLDRYPGGTYANAARQKVNELGAAHLAVKEDPSIACHNAQIEGTNEAKQKFIAKFPASPCADVFRRAIRIDADNASYRRADAASSMAEYQKYIEAFPDGLYVALAKDKMAALEAKERGETQNLLRAPTTVSPAAAGAIAPSRTYAIGSNASGYANLRQGPGLGWTILAQIPQGTKGIQQAGDCVPSDDGKTRDRWCPVTWNGYRGHVSLTNLQAEDQSVTTVPVDSTTFAVSSNPSGYANMRRGPGLGWEVVTKIPEGTQGLRPAGTCVASDDGSTRDRWCPVSWNGFNGHVSMTNLVNAQAKSEGVLVWTHLYDRHQLARICQHAAGAGTWLARCVPDPERRTRRASARRLCRFR